MKLLAIDSSTEACSVAVSQQGEVLERYQLAPREHTQKLLPMVDQLLSEAGLSLQQLDAIAFARGPGSFTGLRVCLSVVQGLAYGAELPVVAVSSLAALAQTGFDRQQNAEHNTLVAALDARMNEVYWAAYQRVNGLAVAITEEKLSAPELLSISELEATGKVLLLGPGFVYSERMSLPGNSKVETDILPHAAAVARLGVALFQAGEYGPADQAVPIYLRDEITWKKTGAQ